MSVGPSDDDAVERFSAQRPRLLGLAYRILGTFGDAEDVVQEAWLRWSRTDRTAIERPAAWLTTVTTRLALDRVKAVDRRREQYVGPWLPEPVAVGPGPDEAAEMAESLTLGFLVVLDRLTPVERAVWLLSDVFGEPFSVIAASVGRSEAACRQVASRARRRLREQRPPATSPLDGPLLGRLLEAVGRGDVEALLELLDTDVVLVSDGGPNRRAARRPVVGATRVARFAVNLAQRYPEGDVRAVDVNGTPAVVLEGSGTPLVVAGEQRGGKVVALWLLANPDKLAALEPRSGSMT